MDADPAKRTVGRASLIASLIATALPAVIAPLLARRLYGEYDGSGLLIPLVVVQLGPTYGIHAIARQLGVPRALYWIAFLATTALHYTVTIGQELGSSAVAGEHRPGSSTEALAVVTFPPITLALGVGTLVALRFVVHRVRAFLAQRA